MNFKRKCLTVIMVVIGLLGIANPVGAQVATTPVQPSNGTNGQLDLEHTNWSIPLQHVMVMGERERVGGHGLSTDYHYDLRAYDIAKAGKTLDYSNDYWITATPDGYIPFSLGAYFQCPYVGDFSLWWAGHVGGPPAQLENYRIDGASGSSVVYCIDHEWDKVTVRNDWGGYSSLERWQLGGDNASPPYKIGPEGPYMMQSQGPLGPKQPGDVPIRMAREGRTRTTPAMWRPSTGQWQWSWGCATQCVAGSDYFGLPGDTPAPADFDGDLIDDLAVFRPSVGAWYVKQSSNGIISTTYWGMQGDVPMPADYDGDGKFDFGVFRPSVGAWYIKNVKIDTTYPVNETIFFGQSTDVPFVARMHSTWSNARDRFRGTPDLVMYRPSTGGWFIRPVDINEQGVSLQENPYLGGQPGDIPTIIQFVPAIGRPYDYAPYNGLNRRELNGKWEAQSQIAVMRPSTTPGVQNHWYIHDVSGLTQDYLGESDWDMYLGNPGDVPAPIVSF